jgi:putative flippase GtrA
MNFKDSSAGVVTADADGQHLPEDILKVASTLEANPGCLVLGARKFDREVPMRSLIGNTLTRYIFFFLVGKKISDTQTGLRGLPASFLPHLIKLDGEGYEYEMNMLVSTKTRHIGIVEQEIATVYLENNRLSHFNPFLDSMKIYFLLLRFALSSAATSLLDFIVFAISFQSTRNILASMALARFVSVNINFIVNRNLVFHNKNAYSFIIVKFYVAAIIMGTLSYVIIKDLSQYMGVNVILAKVATESVLFLFSFMLQRDLIFTSSPLAGEGPSRLSERA